MKTKRGGKGKKAVEKFSVKKLKTINRTQGSKNANEYARCMGEADHQEVVSLRVGATRNETPARKKMAKAGAFNIPVDQQILKRGARASKQNV